MALLNCHECGKQVSSEAKVCQSCGAKVRIPKKKTSKLLIYLLGFLVFGAVIVESLAPKGATTASSETTKPTQTDAEKAAMAKDTRNLNLALVGAKAILSSAKDPDSLEWKSIIYHPDGAACYSYRARNSFNAMILGNAVLANGKILVEGSSDGFSRSWNKECTKADGEDGLALLQAMRML
jgi:hypothetical protein